MAKKLKPEAARTVDALRKVLRFTGRETLRELARKVMQYRKKGSESNTDAADLIREATKSKFLHAGAFNKCLALLNMKDEGKRAIWLASFDQYRDALGLDKVKQGALKFDDGGDEDTSKGDTSKAKPTGDTAAANGAGDPPRAETLVDKRKEPTPAEIKEIVDRAEQTSTAKH